MPSRPRGERSVWLRFRPRLEFLDERWLPSGASPLLELEPNDTLNIAQQLGEAQTGEKLSVLGTIGNALGGAADVDWYSFTLTSTNVVTFEIQHTDSTSSPILSIYNANPDPYDFSDPFAINGHRLLGQTDEGQVDAELTLASGTYFLAVSGAGNNYFHPFLAGSGFAGVTGGYSVTITSQESATVAGEGPRVIATTPGKDKPLASSPLMIRVSLNAPLDPSTIQPGSNIRLLRSTADGLTEEIAINTCYYNGSLLELQLTTYAPLKPGVYQLQLSGDSSGGAFVLADPNGVPLGARAAAPTGEDFILSFEITGVEETGNPTAVANDTAAGAIDLGDLTSSPLDFMGVIGDDPFYDPMSPDMVVSPSSDVDLVHFHLTGPGTFAFVAEVFAGRFGSPFDSGVSLYRLDPATGLLVFIDGNNDTCNTTSSTQGTLPLCSDSALFVGLTEGDYYIAISANYNTPRHAPGFDPGTNGIFDPNVSHSGSAGFSTGAYVLRLSAVADNEPPRILATTPSESETLDAPPATIEVQFSETMNLRQLVTTAFDQNFGGMITSVFLEGANGTRYVPRLESYDAETNTARFQMLDALPNDLYALHFSGLQGLTDLAGNALAGNDADTGDYVVFFDVAGPPRGSPGDSLKWQAVTGDEAIQDLGVLFPHDLEAGVVIARTADASASDTSDVFQFTVIQSFQTYTFGLGGDSLPEGVQIDITDAEGNPVVTSEADPRYREAGLTAGTYQVHVIGWTDLEAATLEYTLSLHLLSSSGNPPPLTSGAAPVLQLRFSESSLPTIPSATRLSLPPEQGPPASEPPGSASNQLPSIPPTFATSLTIPSQTAASNGSSDISRASTRVTFPVAFAAPIGTLQQLGSTLLGGEGIDSALTISTTSTSVEIPATDGIKASSVLAGIREPSGPAKEAPPEATLTNGGWLESLLVGTSPGTVVAKPKTEPMPAEVSFAEIGKAPPPRLVALVEASLTSGAPVETVVRDRDADSNPLNDNERNALSQSRLGIGVALIVAGVVAYWHQHRRTRLNAGLVKPERNVRNLRTTLEVQKTERNEIVS